MLVHSGGILLRQSWVFFITVYSRVNTSVSGAPAVVWELGTVGGGVSGGHKEK